MEKSGQSNEPTKSSPQLRVEIGQQALKLNWYNTLVRFYMEPYMYCGHVEVEGVDKPIFDRHLMGILRRMDFPTRMDPEPTLGIVREWDEHSERMLDRELDKILKGDE